MATEMSTEWSAEGHWAWLLPMSVVEIEGVGARRAAALGELGLHTVGQLLLRLPRRYIDRSRILPIAHAPLGEEVTLIVSVLDCGQSTSGRRRSARTRAPTRARMGDHSGELDCVWFHGYYQGLKEGDTIAISGKIEPFGPRLQIVHPEIEPIGESAEQGGKSAQTIHTGSIVPVYGCGEELKSAGLTSRRWRSLVRAALDRFAADIEDRFLPEGGDGMGLPGLRESLQAVHAPASLEEAERGRRRLAFDELLGLQMDLGRRRQVRLQGRGIAHRSSATLVPEFLASLPFSLTAAQERVKREILEDMASPHPMRRLLHGEVGSGKTVVALFAALTAVEGGCQVALMVPTEVLAQQHFTTIQASPVLAPLSAVLLLGGQRAGVRTELLAAVQSGRARLVIGTHALIQNEVRFERLGLSIVDEQHRFGVEQRAALSLKGPEADVLVMTATPIPRSLALTMYGDLDISTLDELPAGRRPVRTAVRTSAQRPRVLEFVARQLDQGRQAYFVYPMIDESERAGPLASASAAFDELSSGLLSEYDVRFLHGRMSSDDKSQVMGAFSRGECQALVCTSVVEVGLDVPGATIMVIENADRFGLAQLHQLRGRVGRGGADFQAYCIMISDHTQDEMAAQRLQVLCETDDGFRIAQKDLELRGPGELQGTRQAGMPGFLIASPMDEDLLVAARDQVRQRLTNKRLEISPGIPE